MYRGMLRLLLLYCSLHLHLAHIWQRKWQSPTCASSSTFQFLSSFYESCKDLQKELFSVRWVCVSKPSGIGFGIGHRSSHLKKSCHFPELNMHLRPKQRTNFRSRVLFHGVGKMSNTSKSWCNSNEKWYSILSVSLWLQFQQVPLHDRINTHSTTLRQRKKKHVSRFQLVFCLPGTRN